MVVRANVSVGGKYNVYVNGVKILSNFNCYTNYINNGYWLSPSSGITYKSKTVFIIYDCWINNLTEYGKAKIKFEYAGAVAGVRFKGLSIDYIDFIPDYKVKY
jgi:hypothetical protein